MSKFGCVLVGDATSHLDSSVGYAAVWGMRNNFQRILAEFRENGADLSKPHKVTHHLYFYDRAEAGKACRQLQEQGLDLDELRMQGIRWEITASHQLVLTVEALNQLQEALVKLASAYEAITVDGVHCYPRLTGGPYANLPL